MKKLIIIIFTGWHIGVSGYIGYSLLNDADFLATLPQLEIPDLHALFANGKNQAILAHPDLPASPSLISSGYIFRFFSKTGSLEKLNPILRC